MQSLRIGHVCILHSMDDKACTTDTCLAQERLSLACIQNRLSYLNETHAAFAFSVVQMLNWKSASHDFKCASNDEVRRMFELASNDGRVRRVSERFMAKKANSREYQNQLFAWETLNGAHLRIPEPIHYVHGSVEGEDGIMVMEFLDGCSWDEAQDLDESYTNEQVHKAIQHMHKATLDTTGRQIFPGPLDGGYAESFPWGRGQKAVEVTFTSIQDIEYCIRKRLDTYAKRIKRQETRNTDFLGHRLAVCHGDLAPRNILILADGQVALLDWEWMCIYPAIFDLACLSMLDMEYPHPRQKLLLECLKSDACLERSKNDVKEDMKTLCIVDRESLRWHFR